MANARLHRGLVAMSASAVAAIYMAGYLRTQSADADIGAAESVAIAQNVATAAAPTLTIAPARTMAAAPGAAAAAQPSAPAFVGSVPTGPPALAAAPTAATASTAAPAAPAAQAAYKDGTYSGQGSSRRGGVVVAVVVQGGRIASVTITNSTLQYPVRDIAGLPAEVVARQSAQVDTVSRATYSSQAFRGAVAQALTKAA
jgi:uncharacterized protein with FMN-binding domain